MEDPKHPYARALESNEIPYPTPSNFMVDNVKMTINEDGDLDNFARVAIVSSNGIYVFFADEDIATKLSTSLAKMVSLWHTEKNGGLVVADTQDMKNIIRRQGYNGKH